MVSVIIPVYNEPVGLQHTVDSFLHQNFPSEAYEIIIVDNGSKDNTFEEAKKYEQQYPHLIKALQEASIQGSYAARNKGLEVASGDLICFIDADMTVAPDYLSRVVKVFETDQPDYIGCEVNVYTDKNTLAAKYNQLHGFHIAHYLKVDHFVPTCCLSVSRSVFGIVGNFDHRLESGGDYEFGRRVFKAGLKQQFAGHIVVQHPARWKYSSLVKKYQRVARGLMQLHAFYPEDFEGREGKYFNKKKYLPKNPWKVYKSAKKRQVLLKLWEVLALCFYHIPITYHSFAELKKTPAIAKPQRVLEV